ncbi:GTPase IMAP family member 5-like isoform 2-T2 [Tautogolabrus adspersus]
MTCFPSSFLCLGWWLNGSNVQMGAFTVVGYLLYRFSQTLPALIRWPIRLFCSLTGLSALWSWVSHLVGTLRGIQSLCKWLSRVWKFFVGSSNDGALESEIDPTNVPSLRLILLGPTGGQSSLSNTLLGTRQAKQHIGHLTESTKIKTLLDGREVTVITTPDILGPSLGNNKRAKEALRSLQLASPGPHVFMLMIPAPESSTGINQEAAQAIQATRELYGDGAVEFIIPVLTHAVNRSRKKTEEKLLDGDAGGLRRALSPCDQMPVRVDISPDRPQEEQSVLRRHLLGRVMEMKTLRGHFVHELQRREDRIREELLADMTSEVARKLGHM